jgi:hypothetical protein
LQFANFTGANCKLQTLLVLLNSRPRPHLRHDSSAEEQQVSA